MHAIRRVARYWPLFWWIASSAAWAGADSKVGEIRAIEFQIAPDNLDQFGFALSAVEIAAGVRNNLAEWDYPLPDKGPYSHDLKAELGEIEHSGTPVGFSFSSGNSDPRAMDFQKADVLPIACEFRSAADGAVIAKTQSTFSTRALAPENGQTRITEKLIDLISTACFNLLDELPKPKNQSRTNTTSTFKPKWMPDVRVEVKETPIKAIAPLDAEKIESENNADVEVEKEIIIHNQGTPVIFKFGHERR